MRLSPKLDKRSSWPALLRSEIMEVPYESRASEVSGHPLHVMVEDDIPVQNTDAKLRILLFPPRPV
jgi:hypothetical protein